MADFIMAAQNGRTIPTEDKIFGISRRANEMKEEQGADAVINATIGALLDDDGDLMVLSSVDDTFMGLEPEEYASYAPIGGTPAFREAVIKAAFGKYQPKGFVEAVASPGGTGAIRNVMANYSCPGDKVLTSDWHWSPYGTIAAEIGRSIDTYEMFTEDRRYNVRALQAKIEELLAVQDRLVVIINTPAHNPTGYALTVEDWKQVVEVLRNVAPGEVRSPSGGRRLHRLCRRRGRTADLPAGAGNAAGQRSADHSVQRLQDLYHLRNAVRRFHLSGSDKGDRGGVPQGLRVFGQRKLVQLCQGCPEHHRQNLRR